MIVSDVNCSWNSFKIVPTEFHATFLRDLKESEYHFLYISAYLFVGSPASVV